MALGLVHLALVAREPHLFVSCFQFLGGTGRFLVPGHAIFAKNTFAASIAEGYFHLLKVNFRSRSSKAVQQHRSGPIPHVRKCPSTFARLLRRKSSWEVVLRTQQLQNPNKPTSCFLPGSAFCSDVFVVLQSSGCALCVFQTANHPYTTLSREEKTK